MAWTRFAKLGLGAVVSGSVAGVLAGAAPVAAAAPAFSAPLKLPNLPGGMGGEPSIAADPTGNGFFYVTTPQGIPALFSTGKGVAVWVSGDHAVTFDIGKNIGSAYGGGDSDVTTAIDQAAYVADLEGASSAICKSSDHGASWQGPASGSTSECQGFAVTNQAGVDEDREWLLASHSSASTLYITWHDLTTTNFGEMDRSDDGGASWQPVCQLPTIMGSGSIADETSSPANTVDGNVMSRPVMDRSGAIYDVVDVTPRNPASGRHFGALFLEKSTDNCAHFTETPIYSNPGGDFENVFPTLGVDGAGNLYVAAAGETAATQSSGHMWLFKSSDGGTTWSAPSQVDSGTLHGAALPALATGAGAGQVAVGWYGETVAPARHRLAQWEYFAAVSADGGASFAQEAVTPVFHYGGICTAGITCSGGGGGNRNLLDFSSATVDPKTGCPVFALPGDPQNNTAHAVKNPSPANAYVVRQVAACFTPSVSAPAPTASPTASTSSAASTSPVGLPGTGAPPRPAAALPLALALAGLALLAGFFVARRAVG